MLCGINEIKYIVEGYTNGNIPDYQMSAFLMAVCFCGMTEEETLFLTMAMAKSGEMLDLSAIYGKKADKHSTGGVGDKTTLVVAPLVAASGVPIAKLSGRGLGFTGGTLDKLESIPGLSVNVSGEAFRAQLDDIGIVVAGQTANLVPADKKLYALRDVTATVDNIPLIASSIMSKKLASGADAIVLDVKCGSGAFMKTKEAATELATSLVKTAQAMGKKASALITNMNTPLGYKTGNFLEIEETVECLQGKGPADVMELTYALGVEMLILGGITDSKEKALELCKEAISSGKALELFLENVALQGGNPDKLMEEVGKRRSSHKREIFATEDGYLKIDAFKAGLAGVTLGVGRNRTEDAVCPDAGFILHKKEGDSVKKGELLMEVYGKDEECFTSALPALEKAFSYEKNSISKDELIFKQIS